MMSFGVSIGDIVDLHSFQKTSQKTCQETCQETFEKTFEKTFQQLWVNDDPGTGKSQLLSSLSEKETEQPLFYGHHAHVTSFMDGASETNIRKCTEHLTEEPCADKGLKRATGSPIFVASHEATISDLGFVVDSMSYHVKYKTHNDAG